MIGPVPEAWLTVVAGATVLTVMFTIGLGIVPGEFRWVLEHPAEIARGLFAVLVAVPVIALVVLRVAGLPRAAEIGVLLMAIAPGAPVALRRSLGAGSHHSFAPALQIAVALAAVVSMPVTVALLNEMYAGHASVEPRHLARQVLTAQIAPIGVGMIVRHLWPGAADAIAAKLAPIGTVLIVVLAGLAVLDTWHVVVDAGPGLSLAIAAVTTGALAVGHLLGGPDEATRTAVAISAAARNAGLALLVAALNAAPPEITRTILAYLAVSAIVIVPYVAWRRRVAPRPPDP